MLKYTNEDIKEAKTIINIVDSFLGIEDFTTDGYDNDYNYCLIQDLQSYLTECSFEHGITKFVIVPNNLPFVIKVAFDKIILDTDTYYYNYNYCEKESKIFNRAKANGYSNFLAETRFFLKGNSGHDYYIHEKVIPADELEYNNKFVSSIDTKFISENKTLSNYFKTFGTELFSASCCKSYGIEKTMSFIDFLNKDEALKCVLEDLHTRNFGWREENYTPVIFDYTGWEESEENLIKI